VFIVTLFSPLTGNSASFEEWLDLARKEAETKGISKKTIDSALKNLSPISRVIELDRTQPEKTITFDEYLNRVVTQKRINQGKQKLYENRLILKKVSKVYGVPPRFIVALWGIETNFGSYIGGFPVISALATLAHDGRRSEYFRKELFYALEILDEGHISLEEMKGSWAGAMGQSQFMPSSFQKFAVDFDNDGRRDIWTTNADVFASASNYLINSKWKTGQTWGREVRIPKKFDYKLASLKIIKSLEDWQTLGVRKSDGSNLPKVKMNASLIIPSDVTGKSFLIYENYRAILRWNRSHYFAMAVGHLADAFIRK
tara:strand:- start:7309 stop:8250 length:942 start_codon:yes stop_codon:yes gene_type:complete